MKVLETANIETRGMVRGPRQADADLQAIVDIVAIDDLSLSADGETLVYTWHDLDGRFGVSARGKVDWRAMREKIAAYPPSSRGELFATLGMI